MLSTKPIQNVGQARSYFYEKDNYYFKDEPNAKELSQWLGSGAEQLGLSGMVEPDVFEEILKGKLPNDVQLGKMIDGEIKHRAGYDLTFNAPKSVSIMAYIGEDKRLIEAHNRSVGKALKYVEKISAQARVTQNGETTYENTNNLIFATFLQDVSRAHDPHLHTHCVTMNATLRKDGAWRALASSMGDSTGEVNGFWERVRKFQRYIGLIYRSELGYEVKQLGYSLIEKDKGLWEISGVDERDLTFFSKRRQDIEKFLENRGMEGAKAASYATLATRQSKHSVNREELHKTWKEFSKTDCKALIENSLNKPLIEKEPQAIPENVKSAVDFTLNYLSERKSVINELELINSTLLSVTNGPAKLEAITAALEESKNQGQLIPLQNEGDHPQFTTRILLEYEQQMLKNLALSKNKFNEIVPDYKVDSYLVQRNNLSTETKESFKTLFSSKDQIIGIDVKGHINKSMSETMQNLARLGKQTVIAIGLNSQHANDLKINYGFKRAETLLGFIERIHRQAERYERVDGKNLIILVDKAEKLSTKEMQVLTNIAHKTNLRLVPIFDQHSTLSQGVGNPVIQMMNQGMQTISLEYLTDSKNICTAPNKLSDYVEVAFNKIQKNIKSISDETERFKMIASKYVNLPIDKMDKTKIIMQTIAQCHAVNQFVHEQLISKNDVKETQQFNFFLPHFLTQTQYQLATSYKEGQKIRFNENYPSLNVKKGDYVSVEQINKRANTLIIKHDNGKTIKWNPHLVAGKKEGAIEVFDEIKREIVIGEKLISKRNERSKNLLTGHIFTVTKIAGHKLYLKNENGKTVKLNLLRNNYRHLDYGYSQTAARINNISEYNIIAHQSSTTRLTSQRHFYKLMMDTNKEVTIFTDDEKRYLQRLKFNSGDKTPVIDEILKETTSLSTKALSIASINTLNQKINTTIASLIKQQIKVESVNNPIAIAEEAVKYAIANCAEREAAFTHKEIIEIALKHALGNTAPSFVEKAISEIDKKGNLIRGVFNSDGTRWTTPKALERERFILEWAEKGRGTKERIASENTIKMYLENKSISEEQKKAVQLIAASQDSLAMIQGAPGVGKTTLLRATNEFLSKQEYAIQYLAPTHSAVKELNKEGLKAITVQKLLANFRKMQSLGTPKVQENVLFVLDESSFTSNRQIKEFERAVEAFNGRALLVGDSKQIASTEAGKPTTILEWNGTAIAYLNDIKRQQNPELLEAVKAAHAGKINESFAFLNAYFIDDKQLLEREAAKAKQFNMGFDKDSIDRKDLRIKEVARQFLLRLDDSGKMPLTITGANKDRIEISEHIRNGLIERNCVSQSGLHTSILEPVHLTEVDRSRVSSFEKGQFVRFSLSDNSIGIAKGEYLKIREINQKVNGLILENQTGQLKFWKPKPYKDEYVSGIEIYSEEERKIAKGDLIRWTRSDIKNNMVGGSVGKVVSVEGKIATVFYEDNQSTISVDLSKKENKHWDYAYAVTTYFSQGKTDEKPIVHIESTQINLANKANFLVMISRSVHDLTIITDNINSLRKQLENNSKEKLSALEVTGEIEPLKNKENAKLYGENNLVLNKSLKSATFAKPVNLIEKKHHWQADYVERKLSQNIESALEKLLGEPKGRTGNQNRYGTNSGSLYVTLSGEKQGWWKDFQTDEGSRSLLSLVQRETKLSSFKDTLEYAAQLVGLVESDNQFQDKIVQSPPKITKEELSEHQIKMREVARKISKNLVPAEGTLVEKYLRDHRGITGKIPKTMFYHPSIYAGKYKDSFPAMVAKIHDSSGVLQSIHITLLDEKTGGKASVEDPKIKFGPTPHSINLDMTGSKKSDISFIAEGLENAMTIASLLPKMDVKSSIDKNGFKRINLEKVGKNVVLCLDNDLQDWRKDKVVRESIIRFEKAGKTVWIAMPPVLNGVKTDFNDWLLKDGLDSIIPIIKNAIAFKDNINDTTKNITLNTTFDDKFLGYQTNIKDKMTLDSNESELKKSQIDTGGHIKMDSYPASNVSTVSPEHTFKASIEKLSYTLNKLVTQEVNSAQNISDLVADNSKPTSPSRTEKSLDLEREI